MNSGCVSVGPTVRIETPEPAEDFVLVCDWASTSMFAIHGGAQVTKQNTYVVKSGEEVACGVALTGGRSSSRVMHPVYWGVKITEEDDVTVYRYTETKLDYLDKQKEKFEAGFWNEYKWPGDQFSYSVSGVCLKTFNKYFEYYLSGSNKFDFSDFRKKYHHPFLDCLRKEDMLLSSENIRPGIRRKYIDPEGGLNKWWVKIEEKANEGQ